MPSGIEMMKFSHVGAMPSLTLSTSVSGESTRTAPIATSSSWVRKSTTARKTLRPADSLTPTTLISGQHDDHQRAADDVPRRGLELGPEQPADVVRHEERRDRDRDHVVEHLAPRREERPELVERAPREARRAARLRVHRGRLGVGGGGAEEEEPGDDEDDRRQAERERRDEAERVVDRRADVAVGGGEEGVDPQDPLEPFQSASCHASARDSRPAAGGPGRVGATR